MRSGTERCPMADPNAADPPGAGPSGLWRFPVTRFRGMLWVNRRVRKTRRQQTEKKEGVWVHS